MAAMAPRKPWQQVKEKKKPKEDEVASLDSGIKVMVRIRPFSEKERHQGSEEGLPVQTVIEVENEFQTCVLLDHTAGFCDKQSFQFDYCFSSFKPRSITFDVDDAGSDASGVSSSSSEYQQCSQEEVFARTGLPALTNAWEGYNACVFAYGQTSSGKTYTMMGSKMEPGIIPRLCRLLFQKVEEVMEGNQGERKKKSVKVQVSFMEIYNEQVKDLLRVVEKGPQKFSSRFDDKPVGHEYQSLRVRHHPLHGPFVEGITKKDVNCWSECVEIIRTGNASRSQGSTSMNDYSSRSHAIFQLWITQTEYLGAKMKGEPIMSNRTAKLNLVDLAGSERTGKTDAKGKQLTEANYINKSLMTLRKVIDTLVGNASQPQKNQRIPPYRESLLTWVLADNFGGNAKTVMIANISPFHQNAGESESTLRYATTAKGVVNRVKVNEDASSKLIRELQAQVKELTQAKANAAESATSKLRIQELEEEIVLSNKAIEELRDREEDLKQMTERFKIREKELLAEQERWKQTAQKLERESAALRKELEESKAQRNRRRTSVVSVADGGPRASVVGGHVTSMGSAELKSANSFHMHNAKPKANFWLDDDDGGGQAAGGDAGTPPSPQIKGLKRKASNAKGALGPGANANNAARQQPRAGRRARVGTITGEGNTTSPKTSPAVAPSSSSSSAFNTAHPGEAREGAQVGNGVRARAGTNGPRARGSPGINVQQQPPAGSAVAGANPTAGKKQTSPTVTSSRAPVGHGNATPPPDTFTLSGDVIPAPTHKPMGRRGRGGGAANGSAPTQPPPSQPPPPATTPQYSTVAPQGDRMGRRGAPVPSAGPRDALDDMAQAILSPLSDVELANGKSPATSQNPISPATTAMGNTLTDPMFQPSGLTTLLRRKQRTASPRPSDRDAQDGRRTPPTRVANRPVLAQGPSTAPLGSQRGDALDDMRRTFGQH